MKNLVTLWYVCGIGRFSTAKEAFDVAEQLAVPLRTWYEMGQIEGCRASAIIDEDSYDEAMLDPDDFEHVSLGRFPFVCASISFYEEQLPEGMSEPAGWRELVDRYGLKLLGKCG